MTGKKTFNGKKLSFTVFLILISSIFGGVAGAATLTVDDSGGADYVGIQDAINAAIAGDTILVYSGTYTENVIVNKQLILRGMDNGGGKPTVNAGGTGSAITLSADGITLDGFVVTNGNTGISITSSNNLITNNTVQGNTGGNGVSSSYFVGGPGDDGYGVSLISSTGNVLTNNIIQSNIGGNGYAKTVYYGVGGNGGNGYGVSLISSTDNVLTNNTIQGNTGGNGGASGTTKNGGNGGNGYSVSLSSSFNNTFTNNTMQGNTGGSGGAGGLYGNTGTSGSGYGVILVNSSGNLIYNNYFNNINNVYTDSSANTWNITKTSGSNFVDGPYLGGNFWAKPDGTGFSQTCLDVDENGICDSSYPLSVGGIDYLPLTYSPPDVIPPKSITYLHNVSYAPDYINWTWSDPKNTDFDHVMVYIGGSFRTNISKGVQSYNAIGLQPETAYTISTHTVDRSGNINQTWVNDTEYTTFFVHIIGGASYNTIQAAINAASAGDTLLVSSGTYNENVVVNKTLILRGIDNGGGKPIVNGGGVGATITLSADGITIDGFVITNGNIGMNVFSSNNIIKNNTVQNNIGVAGGSNVPGGDGYGIYISGSTNNTFTNNTIYGNSGGASLSRCRYGCSGRWYDGGNGYGIYMNSSTNNTFTNNTIDGNSGGWGYLNGGFGYGIYMSSSTNNIFINSNIHDNIGGVGYYSNVHLNYRSYGYGVYLNSSTSVMSTLKSRIKSG